MGRLPTTDEEVATWADRVRGLLRKLPSGARKVARFDLKPRAEPLTVLAVGMPEHPLKRELEHRVKTLGEILDEL
jgi:hypothetical protein